MSDAFDVRFHGSLRGLARQVSANMSLPIGRVDPKQRLAQILETNQRLSDDTQRLRKENEELHLLLRSALWELARANGTEQPARFIADWFRARRKS
jgi:hypothetical protein